MSRMNLFCLNRKGPRSTRRAIPTVPSAKAAITITEHPTVNIRGCSACANTLSPNLKRIPARVAWLMLPQNHQNTIKHSGSVTGQTLRFVSGGQGLHQPHCQHQGGPNSGISLRSRSTYPSGLRTYLRSTGKLFLRTGTANERKHTLSSLIRTLSGALPTSALLIIVGSLIRI